MKALPLLRLIPILAPAMSWATTITVDTTSPGARIPRGLWGNNIPWNSFSDFYEKADSPPAPLLADIREMRVPSLRYPGGCYSDTFHWEDAIGPKSDRKEQWLNGCKPPAFKAGKAFFGVDEFLHLCETLAAEPQMTLQFRPRDLTTRVQAEAAFTVVTDAPPNKIYPSDFTHDDDKHLSFQDVGDSVTIRFSVPRDGHYRLHLRHRSGIGGDQPDPTAYWKSTAYEYALDKTALSLTGDPVSLSAVDADGYTIWGTARSPIVPLVYGEHTLTITARAAWMKVDYLEIEELNHDQSVKRATAWVAYCNGHPSDDRPIGVDAVGIDWKTVGHWATLRGRPEYGNHPESYGVKYWEVGNEAWGPDPYGTTPGIDPNLYADAWEDYYAAIRVIDPSLRLSMSSNSPNSQGGPGQWSEVVVKRHGNKAEMLHYHPYYPFDCAATQPEKLYLEGVTASVGVQTSLDEYRKHIRRYWPDRLGRIKLSASEWAAAYCWWGPNIDWAVRWTGAMTVADEFGTMTRNLDLLENAQYWLLWAGNVCVFQQGSGPNAPNGYFKHSLYEVFKLYGRHFGDRTLPVTVSDSPTYPFHGFGDAIPAGDYPMITAYGGTDSQACYLVVINKDPAKPQTATILWNGLPAASRAEVRVIQATGPLPNYADINTVQAQAIKTTTTPLSSIQPSMAHTFPACSITGFVIARDKPGNRVAFIEAEDVHTVYRDVPPLGNTCREQNTPGWVKIADHQDAVLLPLLIEEEGVHSIRLRLRAGDQAEASAGGISDRYSLALNGSPVSFRELPAKTATRDADASAWSTAQLENHPLTPGRHYLRITANTAGGGVDWIEIENTQPAKAATAPSK